MEVEHKKGSKINSEIGISLSSPVKEVQESPTARNSRAGAE